MDPSGGLRHGQEWERISLYIRLFLRAFRCLVSNLVEATVAKEDYCRGLHNF